MLCSTFLETWDDKKFINRQKTVKPLLTNSSESYFEDAFLSVWHKRKPIFQLKTSEFILNEKTQQNRFHNPVGTIFSPNENITYSAINGVFNQGEQSLRLFEDVQIKTVHSTFESDTIDYFFNTDRLNARGRVKTTSFFPKTLDTITVSSNALIGNLKQRTTTYYGKSHGLIKRKRAYEEGVSFQSETLTLNLNDGKMDLNNEVSIKRGPLLVLADKGEIFLENFNKRFKYFVLNNNVQLEETITTGTGKEKRSFKRKAFSEKMESILSENKIILTGNPKVFQKDDVIRGNIITLRENNETIEVEDANTNLQLNK